MLAVLVGHRGQRDIPVDHRVGIRLDLGDNALDAAPPLRGRDRLARDLASVVGVEGERGLDRQI